VSNTTEAMMYRKVTAIVASTRLPAIEEALQSLHISGVSVSQVRGYGEYRNFYQTDMMDTHARIEMFCRKEQAKSIAQCVMKAAHTGVEGDGVVAILPVEHMYCIRTQSEWDEEGCF